MAGYDQQLNELRQYQYRLEQEMLHRHGLASLLYEPYLPPQPARTNMKEWIRTLREDHDRNDNRIQHLVIATSDSSGPVPKQDIELMTTELHLRRALSEVLKQRMNTEAAKN